MHGDETTKNSSQYLPPSNEISRSDTALKNCEAKSAPSSSGASRSLIMHNDVVVVVDVWNFLDDWC